MKIAIVTQAWRGGGAEYVARSWHAELKARGHDCLFIATNPRAAQDDFDGLCVGHAGRFGLVRSLNALAKVLNRRKPDVVLALLTYPNLLTILATGMGRRIPVVVSERNMPSQLLRSQSWSQVLQLWAAKVLYRRAAFVVAISHPVAAEVRSVLRVKPERCVVVPNPSLAKMPEPTIGQRFSKDNIAEHGIDVVMPGRIATQKRHRLLLDAVEVLMNRSIVVRVHLFGDGPLHSEIKQTAQHKKVDVSFYGWVENWHEYCRPSSIVVLTSAYEGLGNVLVEATSMGFRTVALSEALGVSDAVLPGVTGYLCARSEPEPIADAIVAAAELNVPDVSGWLQRFSLPESTRVLEDILESSRR